MKNIPDELKEFPYFNDLWEYSIGAGWTDLFYELCQGISQSDPPEQFSFIQIKEKFGGLQAYCGVANDKIFNLIDRAENESYKICENCGSRNNVTSEGSWIKTLCDNCRGKK